MSDAVASPCISVCTMDEASGFCLGCGRTLPEVAAWMRMSDAQKRAVLEQLAARKERLGPHT